MTEPDGNANVAVLLWQVAATSPDRTAVVENGSSVSYAWLRDRAQSFAAAIAERVRPNDRVGILLRRGPDAVAAYFGVMAAGAMPVMIDEGLRPRQIEAILEHAGASLLVTRAASLTTQPRELHTDVTTLDADDVPDRAGWEPVKRLGEDPAQIVYTSGSTGQTKGVTFSHANIRAATAAVVSYLGIDADDRIASLLPFAGVYGLNQLLSAVGTGATLVVESSPIPDTVVRSLAARGVTVAATVPPHWMQLLRVPMFREQPIPSLRLIQNAGGHIPVAGVRALMTAQPQARLFLQYGLTEVFRSTYVPPERVRDAPDAIGGPIPHAEVMVLRPDGTSCDVGEVGELVHRGPTVALGYWNDPDASARTFRPNPRRPLGTPPTERVVYTGDLVVRGKDGFIRFVGRRDRMIKRLGHKVAPDEVLDVVFDSGEVDDAEITSEPDERTGERIIAHVVLRDEGSADRLRHFCRMELPSYMQPAEFRCVPEIPRLGGGKHDLAALLASHRGTTSV